MAVVDANSALGIFLSISPVVVCILCFSFPGMSIHAIYKRRSTGDFPLATFYIMAIQCSIWFVYGLFKNSYTVWFPNGVGVVLGYLYTIVFIKYYRGPVKELFPQIALGLLTLVALFFVYLLSSTPETYFGLFGAVGSIMFTASPLFAIATVLKTRSLATMPCHTSFILFLNASLWTGFGILVANDPAVYVPNLVGLFAGTLQVIVHMYFFIAQPQIETYDNLDDLDSEAALR